MLDTYFFIHSDKPKFIEKATIIDSDYFIFDLEDSVPISNKKLAYELILSSTIKK